MLNKTYSSALFLLLAGSTSLSIGCVDDEPPDVSNPETDAPETSTDSPSPSGENTRRTPSESPGPTPTGGTPLAHTTSPTAGSTPTPDLTALESPTSTKTPVTHTSSEGQGTHPTDSQYQTSLTPTSGSDLTATPSSEPNQSSNTSGTPSSSQSPGEISPTQTTASLPSESAVQSSHTPSATQADGTSSSPTPPDNQTATEEFQTPSPTMPPITATQNATLVNTDPPIDTPTPLQTPTALDGTNTATGPLSTLTPSFTATSAPTDTATSAPTATPTSEATLPVEPPATPIPSRDLNGDGQADLLVLGSLNDSSPESFTHFYPGTSAGYGPEFAQALPSMGAASSCSADFNQDGFRDIFIANLRDNDGPAQESWLYLGSAQGFAVESALVLPSNGASDCAVGDFDNDGYPDLVVSHEGGGNLSTQSALFWGGSDGLNASRSSELDSGPSRTVSLAPITGDIYPDLLFTASGGSSTVLVGSNSGFDYLPGQNLDSGPTSGRPIVADLDNDGYLDLALTCAPPDQETAGLCIFFGPGFSDESDIFLGVGGANDADHGDYNADGFIDLAVASSDISGGVTIFHGAAESDNWIEFNVLDASQASALSSGRLNGDNFDDLTIASVDESQGTVAFYGGPDGLESSNSVSLEGQQSSQIYNQDLDGDGLDEILVATEANGGNSQSDSLLFWNSPRGLENTQESHYLTKGSLHISHSDLNKDGYEELIYSNFYDGESWELQSPVYWGTAAGPDPEQFTLLSTLGARQSCVGDLDGNGWPDIVFANSRNAYTKQVNSYIYWGDAEGFSEDNKTELPTLDANACLLSDLDNDTDLDLVFANSFDDNGDTSRVDSYVYWNTAGRFSTANRSALPTVGAVAIAAGDLNEDNWPDLIFTNFFDDVNDSLDNDAYIYLGSESGFLLDDRLTLNAHGGTAPAIIEDIDGDGFNDVLLASYYNGSEKLDSYIYWGSDLGLITDQATSLPANRVSDTLIADIDNDGRKDIVLATDRDGTTNPDSYIYFGDGFRFISQQRMELETARTSAVTLGDFNGDGLDDLAFATYLQGSDLTNSPVFINDNKRFESSEAIRLPTKGPSSVEAADLDANNKVDLIYANRFDGSAYTLDSSVYWNNGQGLAAPGPQRLGGFGSQGISVYGLSP